MLLIEQTKWRATGHLGNNFGQRSFRMPLANSPFVRAKGIPLGFPAFPRESS
jgi:hypothetical protein